MLIFLLLLWVIFLFVCSSFLLREFISGGPARRVKEREGERGREVR